MFKRKRFLSLILCAVMLLGMLPATYVSASGTGVLACVIDPADPGSVVVQLQAAGGIATDDSQLYLFAVPTYVDSIADQVPVASVAYTGSGNYGFRVPLGDGTAASLLYSKFYVGVRSGGVFTAITGGNYITNPEQIASSHLPRTQTSSKKGLHISPSVPTDMEELNLEHGYYNLLLSKLISNTPTDYSYTYNGKTYYFTALVAEYDYLISNMTRNGMAVTMTLLNDYSAEHPYLLHPGVAYREGTTFYAVNTSTAQGLDIFAATAHFLAERYNGQNAAYGKVDNWILGNEVNDNKLYYYMGEQPLDTFVQEYLQSFRVMYSAVKSAYANANVYICLEHCWGTTDTNLDYGGKHFIDKFNAYAIAQGNIDWGLSYHPYSFPLNDADILNDGNATVNYDGTPVPGNMVTNQATSPIITMKNLQVLTDYFHSPSLLSPTGQVRSIILGEQGYTSYSNITGQNEARQAANIALSYYIAEMNPDVDAFLLRGHCDTWEGSEFFKFGLWSTDAAGMPAAPKKAYEMYRYLDSPASLQHSEFAKDVLNISDWSQVVPGWNESKFASMGSVTDAPLFTVSGKSGSVLVDGMSGHWEPGYNIFAIGDSDYQFVQYPKGVAIVNSFANPLNYQGVETHFSSAVNAGSFLTLDTHFKAMDASYAGDRLEVKVRLHSGSDVFTAAGVVTEGKDYTLCLDLRQWAGRSSIDAMEVLIREAGQEKTFAGTFTVYNVTGASSVSDQTALSSPQPAKADLSDAELVYQTNFTYTGNLIEPYVTVKLDGKVLTRHQDYDVVYHNNVSPGEGKLVVVGIGSYTGYRTAAFSIQNSYPTVYNDVDYAAVYNYHYYLAKYPFVQQEVGTDPKAVLEHFVTKGMPYALQGIGEFNVLAYAKLNPELQAHFADNWANYYVYHITTGIAEGRSVSGIQPNDMQPPLYPYDGHVPVEDPAVAPTCLTPGKTAGSHCSICGAVIVKQEDLAPLGHDYGLDANGQPDFWDESCDVCGAERIVDPFRPTHSMYRMYNPNSGEHFYTGSMTERQNLEAAGWKYEGVGFTFPATTGKPVYRLFQPSTGEHLYTMDEAEKAALLDAGWNYEGIAFNSGYDTEVPQYRLHNPNASVGAYHFTASEAEKDVLLAAGREYQGIGWYSCWQ